MTARLGRDTLEVTSRACESVKMSEEVPTYGLSGSDDFVNVSDVFLDAARGIPIMMPSFLTSCQRPNNVYVDMEPGDVMLTEDFTLYDAMSALEAMRTRSHPPLLLILVLFRSATLAWTAVLF